ncbi:MAG TPA: ABC transporter permease, partial [Chloroflexi bacterium]|nr:ABC transporter permease [Chloroflexota bacterium]
MDVIFSVDTLATLLRVATPLILAGLGGLVSLQTGDLNIALEGMMLIGAFFAVLGSFLFHSALAGVLFAVTAATLYSALFGLFIIRLRSDVFVVGIALNILAAGLTVFLLQLIFKVRGSFSSPQLAPLPTVHLPLLDSVPIVGAALNHHSLFVYLSWVFVALFWVMIYHTPAGFYLRAAGEHSEALETAGVSVSRIRWIASLISGAMCGLAGAHLSLGYLLLFAENMTAGRGFIALAAVIFGRTNPAGVLLAALLFGFAEGLSLRIQNVGIPSQLTLMLPYLTTLAALIFR